jgi:2-amino-4-hydroxy-6-hydroxymethyldihydropteridine diphosphokinase
MEVIKNEPRKVHLSIGTNLGDRLENLKQSCRLIGDEIGEIIAVSSVYETDPVGFESSDLFYNICISVMTSLSPMQLLDQTQKIELSMGRVRKSLLGEYSNRIIDIDIVLMEDLIMNTATLTIPHPFFSERIFVLKPLEEIDSCIINPVNGFSVSRLLRSIVDKTGINVVYCPVLFD